MTTEIPFIPLPPGLPKTHSMAISLAQLVPPQIMVDMCVTELANPRGSANVTSRPTSPMSQQERSLAQFSNLGGANDSSSSLRGAGGFGSSHTLKTPSKYHLLDAHASAVRREVLVLGTIGCVLTKQDVLLLHTIVFALPPHPPLFVGASPSTLRRTCL